MLNYKDWLLEARKNPELNPKTSINDIIENAYSETEDFISEGIKNLFISLTEIDKLGINPGSIYDTPLGIYSYPARYVIKKINYDRPLSKLPFAGNSKFVNIFNATGNIIDLNHITSSEVQKYYKKIGTYYTQKLGYEEGSSSWKKSVDILEDLILNAHKVAKIPDVPGGILWYITYRISEDLGEKLNKKSSVIWNELFRSIGIDGCIDYGSGIIHSNEEFQAVFFSIKAIKNNKRYYNKYSPDNIKIKKDIVNQIKEIKSLSDGEFKERFGSGIKSSDANIIKKISEFKLQKRILDACNFKMLLTFDELSHNIVEYYIKNSNYPFHFHYLTSHEFLEKFNDASFLINCILKRSDYKDSIENFQYILNHDVNTGNVSKFVIEPNLQKHLLNVNSKWIFIIKNPIEEIFKEINNVDYQTFSKCFKWIEKNPKCKKYITDTELLKHDGLK